MYRDSQSLLIAHQTKNAIERLNEKINHESECGVLNQHRLYRYEEAKQMQGLFNPMFGNSVGKYQRPW